MGNIDSEGITLFCPSAIDYIIFSCYIYCWYYYYYYLCICCILRPCLNCC